MDWKELLEKLNAKRAELAAIFEKAKTTMDGKDRYNLTNDQLEDVRNRNAEIDDLAKQVESAKAMDDIFQNNAKAIRDGNRPATNLPMNAKGVNGGESHQPEFKSLGQRFVESEAYKNAQRKINVTVNLPDFDFIQAKTLMETGAGYAPQSIRTGRVVDYAHRRPMVADLIPQTPIDQASVVYMEETTFTNNAAAAAEGAAVTDSVLVYTERTVPTREIKTWLPVTEVQLEDVGGLQALVDNRLLTMLDLAEEVELVSGSNVAPHMGGFLTLVTQSQAKGADPTPDAIYKAMTKVRVTGFAEPSAYITHPNDWQDIRLLRTVDGIYIWGNPADAGPSRIWGLPVVETTAMTENTGFLGDFQLYSEIRRKRGANIVVSNSHSDYFTKNILAIRADKRAALVIYRLTAFCQVTGI